MDKKQRTIQTDVVGTYVSGNERIECFCQVCNHSWSALPTNLLKGEGCPQCGKKAIGDKLRKSHEQFASELSIISPKIEIIGKYYSNTNKILCKCHDCEHIWEASPSNLLKGSGCPSCAHIQTSFMERTIFYFLQHALGNNNILSRNRSAIGKELDIYIPIAKMAIEPGSWYWHKGRWKRDQEKCQLCKEKGIRLITIYDSFNEEREKYGFDDDVLTFRHNLGELSNRDELYALVQHLLRQVNIQCTYSESDKNSLYAKAKEAASRKSKQDFVKELSVINPNINLLERYQGEKKKTLCECKLCGHKWESDYDHLIRRKQGCPICNSPKKAVINLDTGEVFESAIEAAKSLGKSANAVGIVCRGKAKSCGGYRWAYIQNLSCEQKEYYGLTS